MTKDDMTSPIPRETLAPILRDALEYDPAHSFTVKECHRLVDATLRKDYPQYHVHEQTVRQLLKEWTAIDAGGDVHAREAGLDEHPTATGSGNRVVLYSLTSPVPRWDPGVGAQIARDFPAPRTVPPSRRGRRRRIDGEPEPELTTTLTQPDAGEPNARAELICTLVRELVSDSVSVDRLQARDDRITQLESDLASIRAEAKSLRTRLKKIQSLLGDGV